MPAVPGQEISQVTPATPASQVRTEVKTPAQTPGARDESSGAVAVQHEAVVPVVTEVIATDSKMIENGGSADLPRALDVPGQRQPAPMPMMTPGTQSGASPPQQPLFDDQQLRRFQELFQQAPWLYPGGPVAFHQPAIQPPISRPLFLEQDERRMQETVGMGSQYVYPYGPAVGVRENLELKKGIEEVLENRKLREKVERLEKAQLPQSEEDPKFSTPTGDNPKEAETPNQEADRPPKGSQSYHRSQQEAETPYQEAERPPKPESRQGSKPKEYKEADRPPKNGSDEEPTTVKVMLKLMEGMQAIQRQMLEHRDEETGTESVRQAPALPALSEWSATTGPIDLNDWMALIEPMMCDLSNSSAQWWQQLVMEAHLWYQRHLQLPPLDRVAHVPAPSTELAKPKWARLERRASTLLLMAVPEGQREELISAKRLRAMAIICQLLVTYQPGGLAEKELILRSLELPPESSNLVEAVQSLRRWARWRRRAADLQISEPDPFLLLKGLNRIIRKPLENNRGLSFRISLARSILQVDSTPTSTSVTSFALHLVAEFEQVVHQETSNASKKRVEPEKAKVSKLKKLEEEGRSPTKKEEQKEEKGRCKFFLSNQGRRRGKMCSWSHDQKDEKSRCWNCGCPDHMSPSCPQPKDRNDLSPQKPKIQKAEGEETSSPTSSTKGKEEVSGETASMKELLEQANTMLKSLTSSNSFTSSSTTSSSTETKDEVMDRLQQQLNHLKLKVFKINQISHGQHQGLIDSGATHPLRPRRPGECDLSYKKVSVTLANGESTTLQVAPGGIMVTDRHDVEPILPMGQLVHDLGCQVKWAGETLNVIHPVRGQLPVQNRNDAHNFQGLWLLDLIEEMEAAGVQKSMKSISFEKEKKWMEDLVESHPVLRSLPQHIKSRLVTDIGD